MDASIVIVNYNTRELTKACVRSIHIKTLGVKYEIIIVDNNSSDGSQEMLAKEFPHTILIANTQNLGFGVACNMGIKRSKGKYVFLLNSDTALINNALKIFYDFMEKPGNEKIWCCGGMLYDGDMNLCPSYGNFPSLLQVALEQFSLVRLFKKFHENKLAIAVAKGFHSITEVPFVCGADMFIRRSHLNDTSVFDEQFYLYFEETYLSYIMRNKGFRSVIIPEAKIIHLVSRSSSKFSGPRIGFFLKSEFLYFNKVYGYSGMVTVKTLHFLACLTRLILTFSREQMRIMKVILKS
jgi:GT2 family glycosyltransferase